MNKLLMAAGVAALCAPLAVNANYNLLIEDELRLFINSGECNVDAATPLFVTLGITTVAEGENAGERQLNLVLSGDDAETLDCFEFDAGAGSDPNVHTVLASAGSGGSISPSGEVYVYHGQRLTFNLNPASGMVVNNASGCGGSLSGNVFQTAPVTSNCSVSASFMVAPTQTYSVTASAGTGGTISPSNVNVGEGSSTSFTITPAEDYEVVSATGCNGNLNGLTYTTGTITNACSVSVTFNYTGESAGACNGQAFNFNGNGTIDCRLWGNGWSGPTGTILLQLNALAPRIMPFEATSNSGYSGRLDLVTAGSAGSRQMWISSVPGGSPLNQSFLGSNVCHKSGAEISLSWEQTSSDRTKCSLVPNATYFINLTHSNCSSSSCAAYWRNNTNGNP